MKPLGGLSWRRGLAELGVVVFGILIALAVDDWYAGLQQRNQEVAWVRGIRDDLRNDRTTLEKELATLEESAVVIREQAAGAILGDDL